MGSVQLQDFAAGWVGGAASVVVGHPLDTIKTRLQAGQGYGNTLNCVLTVYRNESVVGFFKGMSFPLASIAVYSSVVFGVFSNTQRLLSQLRHGDPDSTPVLADVALASMVAGFISVGIGTPVDLVKIRLQMQTQPYIQANMKVNPTVPGFPVYQGPIHCFRTVLQKEGIAGIYRGAGAMLLRDVPGYCLYFIPYTLFCGWITPDGCISPNPSSIWLAGGVAGAISWGTATPMDVVKSRLQADGVYLNKYKGTLDCILQSYQNEGLKKHCQEDLEASYCPEPNQQCGVGEGSAALTEDSHPAPMHLLSLLPWT
ncbi:solute carrier family 25 member 48 isoform X3 [Strigops habroptila]|uniref:solute carrier family 25 member 48 isoform X3 n=1 Tax=Strigops habroptila TaxID=2489341 RepID=UPI0011CFE750|nr:solute carrier family 25 member 48 isoform X3 [Strigops habroptila]